MKKGSYNFEENFSDHISDLQSIFRIYEQLLQENNKTKHSSFQKGKPLNKCLTKAR